METGGGGCPVPVTLSLVGMIPHGLFAPSVLRCWGKHCESSGHHEQGWLNKGAGRESGWRSDLSLSEWWKTLCPHSTQPSGQIRATAPALLLWKQPRASGRSLSCSGQGWGVMWQDLA